MPIAVAIALTFRWFRPGTFVAAGDVSPFLRDGLADELWSGWTHQLTGAGSTSYEMTRLFDVVVIELVRAIGGSPAAAQHLQYAMFAAFAAFGAAYFVGSVVTNELAVGVAGVLAVVNPLVMVSLPLVLPLLSIGMLGVTGGLILRAAKGTPIRGVVVGLATLPASYLAINPPSLATAAAWVVVCLGLAGLLVGRPGVSRAGLTLLRAVPWALALNLWWLVPITLALRSGNAGTELTATTDAASWSWSHAQNTIGNVVTLRAHWGWGDADMLPFTQSLRSPFWEATRWALPALAIAGALLSPRRVTRFVAGLVGLGATLVLIGKGFHAPFSVVNAWFYEHVPLFWLLRDPVNKIGPALLLVELMLAGLAIEAIARRSASSSQRRSVAVRTSLATAILGALIAPWPIWSGSVIADDRGSLPSSHVTVPDDWYSTADLINSSAGAGKVLVLPLGSYYQLTTTWGYHGVDNLAAMLLRRPVLQRLSGGYFGPVAGFEKLLEGVEADLGNGDYDKAAGNLRALGVSHVVIRKDLTTGQVVRPLADPAVLADALARVPGIQHLASFDVADVYEYPMAFVGVSTPTKVHATDPASIARIVGELPPGAAAVSSTETVGAPTSLIIDPDQRTPFNIEAADTYTVDRPESTRAVAQVSRDTSGATIDIQDPNAISIDGIPVVDVAPISISVEGDEQIAIGTNDLQTLLPGDSVRVDRDRVQLWRAVDPHVLQDWSPLEDCLNIDARDPSVAGLEVERTGSTTTLRARAHSACVWTAVTDDPRPAYHLSFDYRTIDGNPARACVWQVGTNRCAELPPMPVSDRWATFEAFVQIEPGTTQVRLFIYADGPDDTTTTITQYRQPTFRPLEAISVGDLAVGERLITLTTGEHSLSLTADESTDSSMVGPWSSVEDCLRLDERSDVDTGLGVELDGDTVRLTARAHSACTWAPITDEPQQRYQISLAYRARTGLPGRICVWQIGPNRCADLAALTSTRQWETFDASFQVDPATTALRLYLYADGPDTGRQSTTTEYSAISIRPLAPFSIRLTPTEEPNPTPTIVSQDRSATARYDISIIDAEGPFLLTFADTYDPEWALGGLPATWTSDHVVVDGYANGWIINGRGSAELSIRYPPNQLVSVAAIVSLTALLLAAIVLAYHDACNRRRRHAIQQHEFGDSGERHDATSTTVDDTAPEFQQQPLHPTVSDPTYRSSP